MKKALATLAIIALTAIAAQAQNVIYSFADNSGAPTTNSANITASNFTGGQPGSTSASSQFAITTTSASTGYTGASGTFSAVIGAKSGSLDPSTSTFFSFTLTPGSGFAIDATAFQLGARSTGSGPTLLSLRTSLDSFGSDAATFVQSADSTWRLLGPSSFSIIGAVDQAITFRIYGSGGTSTAANFRVDDVNLSVTATGAAVPEPTTFAIVLAGTGLLVGIQRFRRKS